MVGITLCMGLYLFPIKKKDNQTRNKERIKKYFLFYFSREAAALQLCP